MLGWEFPPYSHGGLGKACHGLLTSLSKQGVEITFVLPVYPNSNNKELIKIISASNLSKVRIRKVRAAIAPYQSFIDVTQTDVDSKPDPINPLYGRNLWGEVQKFAMIVA